MPAVAQGEGHRRAAPRRDVLRRAQVRQEGRMPRGLRRTSRFVDSDNETELNAGNRIILLSSFKDKIPCVKSCWTSLFNLFPAHICKSHPFKSLPFSHQLRRPVDPDRHHLGRLRVRRGEAAGHLPQGQQDGQVDRAHDQEALKAVEGHCTSGHRCQSCHMNPLVLTTNPNPVLKTDDYPKFLCSLSSVLFEIS